MDLAYEEYILLEKGLRKCRLHKSKAKHMFFPKKVVN